MYGTTPCFEPMSKKIGELFIALYGCKDRGVARWGCSAVIYQTWKNSRGNAQYRLRVGPYLGFICVLYGFEERSSGIVLGQYGLSFLIVTVPYCWGNNHRYEMSTKVSFFNKIDYWHCKIMHKIICIFRYSTDPGMQHQESVLCVTTLFLTRVMGML